MNAKLNELVNRIRELEEEMEAEMERRRVELNFHIERHKVRFEAEMLARHRQLKTGLLKYLRQAKLRHLVSAPVIYALIVPLLLLDLSVSLYQAICFPLYGIPKVRRRDYMAFDRHQLAYLNLVEKLNCAYCAYANGLAAYVRRIAGLTEQYWCPIKHARRVLDAHPHYGRFADFGDAQAYRRELARREADPINRPADGQT